MRSRARPVEKVKTVTKGKPKRAGVALENDPPHSPYASSLDRRKYLALFFVIVLVYLCTLTDKEFDWIGDGQVMFDTAVSLHEFGELGINPSETGRTPAREGVTDFFGKYGLGLSVIEQIPLFLVTPVEKLFGQARSNVLFPMMNMLISALTALLVALCVRGMGCRFRTAALAAVGYAFGTIAWPYASYDFSEPLQGLCLVAAFWLVLRGTRREAPSRGHMAWAGFALGFAVLTKAILILLIPSYALYAWMRLEKSPAKRRRCIFAFFVLLGIWGTVIAALNFYRFGSILEFGYGIESNQFTTPLLTGLYGLLFSLNKGLIFYAPLAVLVPVSLWRMRRDRRKEVVFFVSVLLVDVVAYSKWWSWEGGASWGPRLLLPIISLLVICAAVGLESLRRSPAIFTACIAAGAFVNLLGVLVNFLVWLNAVNANQIRLPLDVRGRPAWEYEERDGKRWYRPYVCTNYVASLSPILGHAWLLRLRYFKIPFSPEFLADESTTPPPTVSFPPIEINLALLRDPFFRSQLRSAHFWLWDTVTRRRREEIYSYPIYAVSIERQGDRAVARGDQSRALQCYERAFEMMPNYVSPALKLSRLQAEREAYKEAEKSLLRYLRGSDRNADQERAARLQLAQYYEHDGDREGALREYRLYLSLHPTDENRVAIERHMAELSAANPK